MVGTLDNIRLNAFYFLASLNDRLYVYYTFIKIMPLANIK